MAGWRASRWLLCAALCCAALQAQAASPRRVFVVGDSTASEYGPERAPRQGWGMQLQSWLDPAAWQVRNHAQSGRSARSFIEEGWLAPVEKELAAGDVLLVQFGHNDEKSEDPGRYDDPAQAFPRWLMRYVTLARAKGATPILVSPLARRKFERGSKVDQLLDTHGLYAQAVRDLAAREHVGLVDLTASSMAWLRALGDEASKPFFMHVPEQGQADDTHLQQRGAAMVACLVVRGWKQVDPALAPTVVRDTDCGAPASALRVCPRPYPCAVPISGRSRASATTAPGWATYKRAPRESSAMPAPRTRGRSFLATAGCSTRSTRSSSLRLSSCSCGPFSSAGDSESSPASRCRQRGHPCQRGS